MKIATVLPNFTIMIDKTPGYEKYLANVFRCFCEIESSGELVDTFKITPETFWHGTNSTQGTEFDFITTLKGIAKEEIPSGVLEELEGFKAKYGQVTLIGPDALMIGNEDILKQVKNSSSLDPYIYQVQDNVVFIKEASLEHLQEIFQYEFNCPIKYHSAKNKTYLILDGHKRYAVTAKDKYAALSSLYNKHPFINEEDLRSKVKVKNEVEEENVQAYIELLIDNSFSRPCSLEIIEIPLQASFKAVAL